MRAYLGKERLKGTPPEAFGDLVYTLLDGKAADALDRLDVEEWEVEGGEALIFDILDARFPGKAAQDKIGEVLDEVFSLKPYKGENMSPYTGRCNEAFDKAEREGIPLPSLARGYIMLRGCRLTPERKAIVLAASRRRRSYEENEVATALRTTFPVLPTDGRGPAYVHAVEGEQDDPLPEEQDAMQVLLTWRETRDRISKEKLSRGFARTPQPNKPDLEKLRRRTRCYTCKGIGHFSRLPEAKANQRKSIIERGICGIIYVETCNECGLRDMPDVCEFERPDRR